MFDSVIRNALIVDGTGSEPFPGTVAIRDGLIAHVCAGDLAGAGRHEIDAKGHVVAPGWVDIHCHYDGQATWDPYLSPSSSAGVTTLVGGNCGVGFAPCHRNKREFLVQLMEGVEDIPGTALAEGIQWEWETFPEFLDALERRHFACDLAVMIPHGAVRAYCLEESRVKVADLPGGAFSTPITDAETEHMAAVVQQAVAAGAMGLSTNRVQGHRDAHGVCVPGTFAQADEIIALARAVAKGGGGMIEMASDFWAYDDVPSKKADPKLKKERTDSEWRWMRHIAREFGLPIAYGIAAEIKTPTSVLVHKHFRHLEDAAAEGMKIMAQVLTRPVGLLQSFDSKFNPFTSSATYQRLKAALGPAELCATMLQPETRAVILSEVKQQRAGDDHLGQMLRFMSQGWSFEWQADYEPTPEQQVSAIAEATGRDDLDVAYDILSRDGGKGVIWKPNFGYNGGNLDQCATMLMHPQCVPGIADAGAHCAVFSDATMSTHLLTHWVRDRSRGPKMPIEFIVKKQCHDTARLFGIVDRGTLEAGMRADINVIDVDQLRIHRPEHVYDLPTGAARWFQAVSGYDLTMVKGIVTFVHGKPTGQLPGRLLRNPHTYAGRGRNIDAHFDDTFKRTIASLAAERSGKVERMDAGEAVKRTMSEGSTGTTHMSRMARALEEEAQQRAGAKL